MERQYVLVVVGMVVGYVCIAGALDPGTCPSVPTVNGIDQTPTDPANWGKCTSAIDYDQQSSNWCKATSFSSWPDGPTAAATKCLKFGRMTVYTGPIMGQTPQQFGACATTLIGGDKHAMIAVSSKYLNFQQGGWDADKGACGQCACVRLHGADEGYLGASNVNFDNVRKYQGLTFSAMVGDRCGECEDDHIDVLIDRPLSFSYYDPSLIDYDTKLPVNAKAPLVNRLGGLRGFSNPQLLRGGPDSPAAVGVYTADWQWAPCSYTHADCAQVFESVGYSGTTSSGLRSWTPNMTRGIDSNTLAWINDPSEDSCGPIINPDGTLIGADPPQQGASPPATTPAPSATPTSPQASPATYTPGPSPAGSPDPSASPLATAPGVSPVSSPLSSPVSGPTPSTTPTPTPTAMPTTAANSSPAIQPTPSPSPSGFAWVSSSNAAEVTSSSSSIVSSSPSLSGAALIATPSSASSQSAEPQGFTWLGLSGWQVGLVIAAIIVGGVAVLVAVVVGTALASRGSRAGGAPGVMAAVSVRGGKGGPKGTGLPVSGGAVVLPMHGVLVHTGATLSRGSSGVTHRHSVPGSASAV